MKSFIVWTSKAVHCVKPMNVELEIFGLSDISRLRHLGLTKGPKLDRRCVAIVNMHCSLKEKVYRYEHGACKGLPSNHQSLRATNTNQGTQELYTRKRLSFASPVLAQLCDARWVDISYSYSCVAPCLSAFLLGRGAPWEAVGVATLRRLATSAPQPTQGEDVAESARFCGAPVSLMPTSDKAGEAGALLPSSGQFSRGRLGAWAGLFTARASCKRPLGW